MNIVVVCVCGPFYYNVFIKYGLPILDNCISFMVKQFDKALKT